MSEAGSNQRPRGLISNLSVEDEEYVSENSVTKPSPLFWIAFVLSPAWTYVFLRKFVYRRSPFGKFVFKRNIPKYLLVSLVLFTLIYYVVFPLEYWAVLHLAGFFCFAYVRHEDKEKSS